MRCCRRSGLRWLENPQAIRRTTPSDAAIPDMETERIRLNALR
jgi:hypothetical protein